MDKSEVLRGGERFDTQEYGPDIYPECRHSIRVGRYTLGQN